ncbi:MAG: type I-C CRISPR-associated protein Cas8c/Csd1 [Deltaproteobacteria bacterium]|nr:type I-C CRISPR-associated protein Cas8c/Csd1 [Deltaproteobacteria bacterium]
MILQALNQLYERHLADPESDVPVPGFCDAKVSFCLLLDKEGHLLQVQDLREAKGKKKTPRSMRVPETFKRTVGIKANFLCDNTKYALGADAEGVTGRSRETFHAFLDLVQEVGGGLDEPGLQAVRAFLSAWEPENAPKLENWEEIAGQNLVFRLDMAKGYVHESPAVRRAWLNHKEGQTGGEKGQCLVTGEETALARLHPPVKGVPGSQTSGAALVSFNLDAFTSYGKSQNFNAPVSERTAFSYTTILNHLLARGSKQKVQIGDATVVFWSQEESPLESWFGPLLEPPSAEDHALNQELAALLQALRQGLPLPAPDSDNPFYVLGLSPNAARLSVRFWLVSTVGQMAERLGQHVRDLEIVRQFENQPAHLSLWALLKETAVLGKTENIPPNLAGEFARAVLTGGPYPRTLLTRLVDRVRADHTMNYPRAALVKAYLARKHRHNPSLYKEVTVTLDPANQNPAYRLGRLFSILESLQKSALGYKLNATIRDKYLSSASSGPRVNFPMLLRLAQAHVKKSNYGELYQRRIAEVLEGVADFPPSLSLEEQGRFFLGYYHQTAEDIRQKIAHQTDETTDPETAAGEEE